MVTIICNPKSQNFQFSLAVGSAVPRGCLLLQRCLGGTDPGMPLAAKANRPSASFPAPTFWTILSSMLRLGQADTIFFFYLASCYQSTMSSQIAQNYSTQEEATLSHLVNLYLQSPAPASLWASISTTRATFPKNWPRRRTRHWESLENSKPVLQQNLPGHAEATSRWVK